MLGPTTTPALAFAAFSGTGKTTLLQKVIPLLRGGGMRLGLIKHCHHDIEIDIPGKDSYLLRQAGAAKILVVSRRRTVVIGDTSTGTGEPLKVLLRRLEGRGLDLILVEGFKHGRVAKIELHRASLGYPLLCRNDSNVIAVASDTPLPDITLPLLNLNDAAAIATFILNHVSSKNELSYCHGA